MNDRQIPSNGSRSLENLEAYFGFAEPGLSWRERCAIFAQSERRSWARLLGSRRPEDACRRRPGPPAS